MAIGEVNGLHREKMLGELQKVDDARE